MKILDSVIFQNNDVEDLNSELQDFLLEISNKNGEIINVSQSQTKATLTITLIYTSEIEDREIGIIGH